MGQVPLKVVRAEFVVLSESDLTDIVIGLEERLQVFKEMRRSLLEVWRCWGLYEVSPGQERPASLLETLHSCRLAIDSTEKCLVSARADLLSVRLFPGSY